MLILLAALVIGIILLPRKFRYIMKILWNTFVLISNKTAYVFHNNKDQILTKYYLIFWKWLTTRPKRYIFWVGCLQIYTTYGVFVKNHRLDKSLWLSHMAYVYLHARLPDVSLIRYFLHHNRHFHVFFESNTLQT